MIEYIIRRLAQMPLVLLVVSVVTFLVLHLTPGDPVVAALGIDADPQTIAALRQKLGLDQPLPVQYFSWIGRVVRGDLGDSMHTGQAVTELIAQRLPVTLTLTLAAMLFAILIAVPLGVLGASRPGSAIDRFSAVFTMMGIAVPNFVVSVVLILVLAVLWPVFPVGGFVNPIDDPLQALRHLALPVVSLGAVYLALLSRMVRVSVAEVLTHDYVRTARAKGLGRTTIVLRHVLRSSLLPVVTSIGISFASLLGGAVIIEQIFFLPGLGRLVLDAAIQRDYTIVQGVLLVTALIFLLTTLATDLLFAYLDPRIRYGSQA